MIFSLQRETNDSSVMWQMKQTAESFYTNFRALSLSPQMWQRGLNGTGSSFFGSAKTHTVEHLTWGFCDSPLLWPSLLSTFPTSSSSDNSEMSVALRVSCPPLHSASLMLSVTFITAPITSLRMTPDSVFSSWSPAWIPDPHSCYSVPNQCSIILFQGPPP